MAIVRISEADAARDFAGLMARVRAGAEIVIDGASAAVKMSIMEARPGRLLSESMRLADDHAKGAGLEPVMDERYAIDMEAIVRNRNPRDTSAWD